MSCIITCPPYMIEPMQGGEILCTLKGIEKRYFSKGEPVLGPLDLTVRSGEILGLRGHNGAGKSTLLGVIAGTIRPTAGSRQLAPQVRGRIGYVPQELSLYESLTGLANLRFWGLACGLPSRIIGRRSRWLLKQMELEDKGRQPVRFYSGGMKRRLHLASALMVTPTLLLLDEPTVGADVHSADLICKMLEHVRDQGSGVILVSHQAGELERVCDRILTLQDGIPVGEEEKGNARTEGRPL